ncbi:MAG: HAD-IA family hydrolase [Terracidiphilus sp.]|jgi:putative hydrolase of the HAD superfamily
MLPFDVILFDVGGVLLTNGWDHRERARVIEQFDLDLAAFEARHPAPNDAWERSVIPLSAYLHATVFYEPRKFSQDEFFAAMCAQSLELPNGALGVLKELSESGKYMVGALNNEARETNEYRFEKFGVRKLLDVSLSSCYLGLRKPELEIYKRALDIVGRPAERVLFIDDRQENVTGAHGAGMRTILFTGAEGLREELAGLGVL